MLGSVVVGYDGRESSHDALALAATFTCAGFPLVAAWVSEEDHRYTPHDPREQRRRRARLDSLRSEIRAHQPGLASVGEPDVLSTPAISAAEGLRALASGLRSGLVVVGSSDRGPAGRVVPGTTARRLLERPPCAVAVAPRGHALHRRHAIRTIAVGVEGTPASDVALGIADELARALGARLVALTARRSRRRSPSPRLRTLEVEGGRAVEQLALEGPPIPALARAAGDLDLLVLGARDSGLVARLLTTSVSRALVDRSPAPVLVVPERAPTPLSARPAAVGVP